MSTTRDTVVLVHGLWLNRFAMAYLAHRLKKSGYAVRHFTYYSALQPFERHCARLAETIDNLESQTVHLVGHSLGGVLILSALPRLQGARLGRVLLLGSPVGGSSSARQFMCHAFGRFCLGTTLELWREFPRLQMRGAEFGAIAGTQRIGLGRFFATLEGPNDGVVTVEETKLPGLNAHTVLPVAHTAMLLSPAVAERATRFLRTGKFEDGA